MVAIGRSTLACLANEADARAAGVAEIWAKVQWRCIATVYRELAQSELAQTADAAEQIEGSDARAGDGSLEKATFYLEQAEQVRDLGLNEDRPKRRDNLLALAENYYLLHDRFVQLDRLHRSDRYIPSVKLSHTEREQMVFRTHFTAEPSKGFWEANAPQGR